MKHRRTTTHLPRLSRDAQHLVFLATALSASGSRLEDDYWENLLAQELARRFEHASNNALDHALEHLYVRLPAAYDVLIEAAENQAETFFFEDKNVALQALLIAAPVLAWSKYAITSGPLTTELTQTLQQNFSAHIAASDARCAVLPYLYSIDQLPKHFSETRALLQSLAKQAVSKTAAPFKPAKKMPTTAPLLADTRYVLAAVVVPRSEALFRWQTLADADGGNIPKDKASKLKNEEADAAAEARTSGRTAGRTNLRGVALEHWRSQSHAQLTGVLTGSIFDLLLPDAYHSACRESDRAIRPYAVKAAVAFLETTLNIEAKELRAVIAAFGETQPEEFRIGFTRRHHPDVMHGAVWPIFDMEEIAPGPRVEQDPAKPLHSAAPEQIEALLRECGITDILMLEEGFPPEFCDDCGTPLFADPTGDLVHAELPEDTLPPSTQHLH